MFYAFVSTRLIVGPQTQQMTKLKEQMAVQSVVGTAAVAAADDKWASNEDVQKLTQTVATLKTDSTQVWIPSLTPQFLE